LAGGFNPDYLKKLSLWQQDFLSQAVGVKFAKEFLFRHGSHLFIVGNTGSGKTQKGYFFLDWLKHTECQIWISTAKSSETSGSEILPLLCQGKKVRIIIPKGCEFDIKEKTDDGYADIKDVEIVTVSTPSEAWDAVKVSFPDGHHKSFDTINIFEFRDTITNYKSTRTKWMISLFESLATRTRAGTMPPIFPCTIYLDESQWLLAGSRITKEKARLRSASIVIENVLEMRSAGCRFVMFAQSYKNIPPVIRDNMLNTCLCRGAWVESEGNDALNYHCRLRPGPKYYRADQGKFVHSDGTSYPALTPWEFPLYPLDENDRRWITKIRLHYGRKHGEETGEQEIQEECLPELGRFSVLAIQPEVQAMVESRWNAPAGETE